MSKELAEAFRPTVDLDELHRKADEARADRNAALRELDVIAYALEDLSCSFQHIGLLPCADKLGSFAEDIRNATQAINRAIGQEGYERVMESQISTGNMMSALFAGMHVASQKS
jgi:hypothetical protein